MDEVFLTPNRSISTDVLFSLLAGVSVGAVALAGGAAWGAGVAGGVALLSVLLGGLAWRNERRRDYAVADNLVQALTDDVLLFLVGVPVGIVALIMGAYAFGWTWWGATAVAFACYLGFDLLATVLRTAHPDIQMDFCCRRSCSSGDERRRLTRGAGDGWWMLSGNAGSHGIYRPNRRYPGELR